MKVTTIKSARTGTATVHMGEDMGWGSRPFCPALQTGARQVNPHAEGTVNCRPCIKEANARYLDVEHLIQISSRVRNLIKAVREHAVANYDTGAWDIIVEAFSDSELAGTVGKCRTAAGAIAKVAKIVEQYAARRAPHDAEIRLATEPTEVQPQPEGPVTEDDGSVMTYRYYPDGELSSATRTWPGKGGWDEIDPTTDEVRYHPNWRGVRVRSDNYCNHDAQRAAAEGVCWTDGCRRPDCIPF